MAGSFTWNAVFLTIALAGSSVSRATAQSLRLPESAREAAARVAISGVVLDESGKPVSGASVELQVKGSAFHLRADTDVSGAFVFRGLSSGDYIVSATKAGLRSRPANMLIREDSQEIELVLGASSKPQTEVARPAMEFADQPNFTVAGVTDWTAVGGHGSDATLRTSESLAGETRVLKSTPLPVKGSSESARTGEEEGVERELEAALAAAPQSYQANHDLGEYYLRAGSYQKAIPLLQSALPHSQKTAEDEYDLALACRGAGDSVQARQHVHRALLEKDSASFHRLAGELDEEAGDPLAAVQQFERATLLAGDEENYLAWGAELLLHRAVWEAAQVFQRGAKAHPDSARLKTAWGTALFAGALYDQAAQQLCEASDLRPQDTETYLVMGKIALASPAPLPCVEQKLARFVGLQPHNADAAYFAAMALAKRDSVGSQNEIEMLLKRAVMLDPKYADASLQLGILAFAKKRYQEAIGFYKQAIAANAQQAEAHYRLGIAYDRVGDASSAKQQFRLHDELQAAQANAVEEQRRKIKQFVVVPHGPPVASEKPQP